MNELSQYIEYRIERLKKTDGLISLSFLIIGVGIATWKYGFEPTALTVFVFFSGLIFAEFISSPKLYFSKKQKRPSLEKGRIIFTLILLTAIVLTQFLIWNKFVTFCSLGIGLTFGLIISAILKLR